MFQISSKWKSKVIGLKDNWINIFLKKISWRCCFLFLEFSCGSVSVFFAVAAAMDFGLVQDGFCRFTGPTDLAVAEAVAIRILNSPFKECGAALLVLF